MGGLRRVGQVRRMGQVRQVGQVGQVGQVRRVGVRAAPAIVGQVGGRAERAFVRCLFFAYPSLTVRLSFAHPSLNVR